MTRSWPRGRNSSLAPMGKALWMRLPSRCHDPSAAPLTLLYKDAVLRVLLVMSAALVRRYWGSGGSPPRAACVRSRYDPSVASASRTFCLRMHSHRFNGLRWVALLPSVQALTTPPPTLFCISFIAPYPSLWQTARLAHSWVLLTCLEAYFLAAFSSESRTSIFQLYEQSLGTLRLSAIITWY